MELKKYLNTLPRGGASLLAAQLDVSPSFLSQMASGASSVSAARAALIEQHTNGQVTRQELRPNDFHLIWPDLSVDLV